MVHNYRNSFDRQITIQEIDKSHLQAVAKIHATAFPDSLITKLGQECIQRYYAWQLQSPDQVYAIAAFMDEKMVGFCFGGVFTMALGGFLSRNKKVVAKSVLTHPWLLFHAEIRKKIIRGLKLLIKFSKFKEKELKILAEKDKEDHFGILAIASNPKLRGLGIGKLLMNYLISFAKMNNFNKMLLTVNPNNINAVNFYEHIGWHKQYTNGKWEGIMRKDLS